MENDKPKTYLISYNIYFSDGTISQEHEIKVKNAYNKVHSQIKLEGYLKKKHKDNFKALHVISCNEDYLGIFSMFGKDNPFSALNIDNPFDKL